MGIFKKVDKIIDKLSNKMIKTFGKKIIAMLALLTIIDAFLWAIRSILSIVKWFLKI